MIEINNLTRQKICADCLEKTVKALLKEEKSEIDVSVALIGQKEIKELNKKYRKKNKPTDVLSFFYKEDDFGEVAICPEEANMGLCRTLIHGVLHLLGYDHEKTEKEARIMQAKEDQYFEKLCQNQR